jgi:hypothetical protein
MSIRRRHVRLAAPHGLLAASGARMATCIGTRRYTWPILAYEPQAPVQAFAVPLVVPHVHAEVVDTVVVVLLVWHAHVEVVDRLVDVVVVALAPTGADSVGVRDGNHLITTPGDGTKGA